MSNNDVHDPIAGADLGATSEPPDAVGLDVLVDGPTPALVREMLHEVIDPEIGLDIVELGLLRKVEVDGSRVRVRFTLTTPACPLSSYIEDEIRACLWQIPGLDEFDVTCEYEPPWTADDMTDAARATLGF